MNTAKMASDLAAKPETTERLDRQMHSSVRRQRRLSLLIYLIALGFSAVWIAVIVREAAHAKTKLAAMQTEQVKVRDELKVAQQALVKRSLELKSLEATAHRVELQLRSLEKSRSEIFEFLGQVSSSSHLPFLDQDVDWQRTRSRILAMTPSPRQSALLYAILLSWKKTPFKFGGDSLEAGIDSPRFVLLVLGLAGVRDLPKPKPAADWKTGDPRVSDLVLEHFPSATTAPEPGDLMSTFVSGSAGRLITFYLGEGVCLGNDGSREGFRIFNCEAYVRDRRWSQPEYRHVDYP
jgi:hypothetical protein